MIGAYDLGGKSALVTGAAGGIGSAIASVLASAGANIASMDRVSAVDTANLVRNQGREFWDLVVDLGDRQATRTVLQKSASQLGTVDIFVHCAGVISKSGIDAISDDEWDQTLEVNLTSCIVITQFIWPIMKEQGRGKIVLIGSRTARTGGLNAGPAYVASKGALHSLVVSLAKQGAPLGILANGVMPGPILTQMTEPLISYSDQQAATPLRRMGSPSDIAYAVHFLASAASDFVTGTVMNVTGGSYLS